MLQTLIGRTRLNRFDIVVLQSWRGVTLVEVIVVLLLISVLAITAIPKVSPDSFTVESVAQRFAADLRRAQFFATYSALNVCVALKDDSGYGVYPSVGDTCAISAGQEVLDPASGQNFFIKLPDGISIKSAAGVTPLVFNSWGIPVHGGASYSLSGQILITVAPGTGYVTITPSQAASQ